MQEDQREFSTSFLGRIAFSALLIELDNLESSLHADFSSLWRFILRRWNQTSQSFFIIHRVSSLLTLQWQKDDWAKIRITENIVTYKQINLLEIIFLPKLFFSFQIFFKKTFLWSLISNWTVDASFYACTYLATLTSNLAWRLGQKKQFLSFLHHREHNVCSPWYRLLQALKLKTLDWMEWEGLTLSASKWLWITLLHFYTLGVWSWFYGQNILTWNYLGWDPDISF